MKLWISYLVLSLGVDSVIGQNSSTSSSFSESSSGVIIECKKYTTPLAVSSVYWVDSEYEGSIGEDSSDYSSTLYEITVTECVADIS